MERGGGIGGWVLVGAWEGVMGLSWGVVGLRGGLMVSLWMSCVNDAVGLNLE